eukprot:2896397-Amphidinium_carterae.6
MAIQAMISSAVTVDGTVKQIQRRNRASVVIKNNNVLRKCFGIVLAKLCSKSASRTGGCGGCLVRWLRAASGDGVLSAVARWSGLGRCLCVCGQHSACRIGSEWRPQGVDEGCPQ